MTEKNSSLLVLCVALQGAALSEVRTIKKLIRVDQYKSPPHGYINVNWDKKYLEYDIKIKQIKATSS